MGAELSIETEPPLSWPDVFLQMDTKYFHRTMFGPRLETLERHLKLDLTPLKHCALEDELFGEKRGTFRTFTIPKNYLECPFWGPQTGVVVVPAVPAPVAGLDPRVSRAPPWPR